MVAPLTGRRAGRGLEAARLTTLWLSVTVTLAAPLAFSSEPARPVRADAVVAQDGSGQFASLQAAIAAAPAGRPDRRFVIHVKPGIYRERIYVQREKRFLTLVGEDAEKTVVRFNLDANVVGADGRPIGTFRTATAVVDADDFLAQELSFENTAGPVGQALALRVDGDRAVFRNCRFLGWQDTVFLNRGRQYFEDGLIAGHVDFIFGAATAFFSGTTILVREDGYVTAASTPAEQPFGFVFSRCAIRGQRPGVRTYLGRPWRAFAKVAFLHTEMSDVVRAEGWHDWDRPERRRTATYLEHDSRGDGARPQQRVAWARDLDADEASRITPAVVLGGSDGWDPEAIVVPRQESPPSVPVAPAAAAGRCPAPARFRPDLVYSRAAGERLHLDVCVPRGRGPYPAVLLVHGGGWISGERTRAAIDLVRPLTEAGIAWIAVGYRLAPGHRYPAPIEDLEAAIRWVKRNGAPLGIDARHLALVGESAGGHLAAAVAARATEATRVAAVASFFGPVDLERDADRRGGLSASMRALFGRSEWDAAARTLLRQASPLRHLRPGLPPFLLVHGTADMSVPFEQSQRFQARLRAAGVPCDLLVIPDGGHGTSGWDALLPDYRQRVVAWLGARLRPPSIALVGDSTVTDEQGWGRGFAARLAGDVRLHNLARGGRSSKSYRAEGHWREVLRRRPSYVLVQFGHNDMPGKGPERETEPATTFRANLARYVDEARAVGSVPVLVTPLTRRRFGDDGRVQSDLEAYAEAARDVAREKRVALVDLHARSTEHLNALGAEAASALDAVKPDGTADRTHLDGEGSALFGSVVADELRRALPALGPAISADAVALSTEELRATAPWVPDRGDGTYQNPVLFQDISDPDAIRVGEDFYLVSSTFSHVPGLTLLHSKDLVNWSYLTSVLPRLPPAEAFRRPSRGNGVWAPALRHHAGRYWIYYPDPDRGIFVTTAPHPRGPWSAPVIVAAGKGLIDPCPFWDDDGRGWLVHAWARSRAGFANVLTLHRLSADGLSVADEGRRLIDGDAIPGYRTLEGPKLYKRNGYYYVFAPAGGVKEGWQSVFRASSITGPYEDRIVLEQGRTAINGPHQGAWVTTPSGEDWFLHFQDREAFGRVVHLEPLRWVDDWPVIGADEDGDGRGEPVLVHAKPEVRLDPPVSVLDLSDEFTAARLGPQWQWEANPEESWYSLAARPGHLRLLAQRSDADERLWPMASIVSQRLPGPAFRATAKLQLSAAGDGERAGLVVLGLDYAWIGLRRAGQGLELEQVVCRKAAEGEEEIVVARSPAKNAVIWLRVDVDERARCRFGYSLDGKSFLPFGSDFQAQAGRWVGARLGLFALARPGAGEPGHADFDWIRVARGEARP